MKTFLSLLLIIAASAVQAQTIQTLKAKGGDPPSSILIGADQSAELLTYVSNTTNRRLLLDLDGVPIRPYPTIDTSIPQRLALVFKGPAVVTLDVSSASPNDSELATFKITSAKDNLAPSNAVVIPADANGPSFNVILEQSADLLTWTAASPGTYTPSTEKRFFRVRIVPL